MAVKQLSVFIENRKGMLSEVTDALSDAHINLRALCLAEAADYGILRLIVDDTEKAVGIVRDTGRTVVVNDVVGVIVPDTPGGLNLVLHTLNGRDVGIDYMYAFISKENGKANVVFRTSDVAAADKYLSDAGFELI